MTQSSNSVGLQLDAHDLFLLPLKMERVGWPMPEYDYRESVYITYMQLIQADQAPYHIVSDPFLLYTFWTWVYTWTMGTGLTNQWCQGPLFYYTCTKRVYYRKRFGDENSSLLSLEGLVYKTTWFLAGHSVHSPLSGMCACNVNFPQV